MSSLAPLSLLALILVGLTGCGPTCDDVEEAANACYAEAGRDGEFSCDGTPPADVGRCQVDVYESADCSTVDGTMDADASANACAISGLF